MFSKLINDSSCIALARRFPFNPGGKAVAERDPIFFIVSCRNVRKEEAKEEAADPLCITHNYITLSHPARIRQRMYHVKSV